MPTSFQNRDRRDFDVTRFRNTHMQLLIKWEPPSPSHNLDIHYSVDVLNLWHLHSIDDISSSISRQLDQGKRILTRIVSSEWSAACVTSLHSLRASPALPPQHNTFIIDTHHLRDTFNTMSFLHRSDFSATHVLPLRKRLVSHNIVCHRQDTFLVLHGIIPECLLHSNRQMNSIPRLSGQNSDFHGTLLQHIFFVTTKEAIIDANFRQLSSESKNSYLGNASCLGEYGNCLISNLSSRSQTKISHIDNSHLVCTCFCRAATQKSLPTSLILVSTRFALIPGSTNH